MTWWLRLWRRDKLENDLSRELQFHISERIAALKHGGLTEDAARRHVRQEFGGIEQVKEECRSARGTLWLEFYKSSTVQCRTTGEWAAAKRLAVWFQQGYARAPRREQLA